MTPLGAELQRLLDEQEIARVVHQYAAALDRRDWALLESCFTPDARLTMSVAGSYPSPAEYCRRAAAVLAKLDATHHVFTSLSIRVYGDRAFVHSYYTAQHARNALQPEALLLIGGWVDDEFVRAADGWRIAARNGTAVWFDGNPAVLGLPIRPGANPKLARDLRRPPAIG